MNNLELKGRILELVGKLKKRESLEELVKIVEGFVGEHASDDNFEKELTEREKHTLEKVLLESRIEGNRRDSSSVINKFKS